MDTPDGIEITGPMHDRFDEILTPEALELIALLHRELERAPAASCWPPGRSGSATLAAGGTLDFLRGDRARSARTTPGGWPTRRRAWSTGGSRSPARPTGR